METIPYIVAGICFVLAVAYRCQISWLKGSLALEKRFNTSLAKDRFKAMEESEDGQTRIREYLDLHRRDQEEIEALRELSGHQIADLGPMARQFTAAAQHILARQKECEERLAKIPTTPPPTGCS